MIDDQRFRARLRALDAAVHMVTGGGRNLVNNDAMITDAAEHFERWLLRPADDAATPTTFPQHIDRHGRGVYAPDQAAPTLRPGQIAVRAECGAFLRPAWYGDAMEAQRPWPVCSGVHNEHGWHIGQERDEAVIFHSHHAVGWRDIDVPRCSCGGAEWPCPDAHPTDMRI